MKKSQQLGTTQWTGAVGRNLGSSASVVVDVAGVDDDDVDDVDGKTSKTGESVMNSDCSESASVWFAVGSGADNSHDEKVPWLSSLTSTDPDILVDETPLA